MSGEAQMVYIKWRDAHSVVDGWHRPEDIDVSPAIVESVGWLLPDVSRDDHLVVVVNNLSDEYYDSGVAIPVECVLEIRNLKLGSRYEN